MRLEPGHLYEAKCGCILLFDSYPTDPWYVRGRRLQSTHCEVLHVQGYRPVYIAEGGLYDGEEGNPDYLGHIKREIKP